jgi:hypothetical protein
MVFRAMRDQRGTPHQQTESRRLMDEARNEAYEGINEVERLMREELAGL